MIPEKGDFANIAAPALLLRIAESGLTGILYLKQEETLKALHFDTGRLVWAISNSVEDKLERILLEGRLVDELELNRLRRQQSGAALGKSLLERGLLSVEQLVECTRMQFKRILDDVLAWTRGGFQVIESPPPENLFKMDLDLVSMVFNFVLENVSADQVRKRFQDLSVCPESRAEESRLPVFNLSQKKQEFLAHFNGRQSLEAVLSHYADSHRDALLKVAYFFLLADLVRLPGEPGPMDEPLTEPTESIPDDSQLPEPSPPEPERVPRRTEGVIVNELLAADVEAPAETLVDLDVDSAEPAPEFYSFSDLEKKEEEDPDIVIPEPPEQIGPDGGESQADLFAFADETDDLSGQSPAKALDVDDMLKKEKASRQGRQLNLLLILVVAILVTGGAIFLLLTSGDEKIPLSPKPVDEKQVTAPDVRKTQEPLATKVKPVTERTIRQTDASPDGKKATQVPSVAKSAPEKTAAGVSASLPLDSKASSALQLLRRGRYLAAARQWRAGMAGEMTGFSILLEMDCQTISVGAAFKRIHEPDAFFLLPRKLGDRTCFLVMWGRFETEQEAGNALRGLPAYFLNQDPPAKIVKLAAYR